MEIMRQRRVAIIGDSPIGILGLNVVLEAMDINVHAVKNRAEAISECVSDQCDAILIDMYLVSEAIILREVNKLNAEYGCRFVIFCDGTWTSGGGITFIKRTVRLDVMKTSLHRGISGGRGEHLKGQGYRPPARSNISVAEVFVLGEWINGRTVTEIAKLSNRSIKTISSHKRNAMKKLMVKNDRELYRKLKKDFV